MVFRFEGLEIWQLAVTFAGKIYDLTAEFPKDEMFGLSSQLKRAATSISMNIAEGSGRSSPKEFAHYLQIANGSIFEIITALAIARNRNFLMSDHYNEIYADAEILTKKITTFRNNILQHGTA